MPDTGYIQVHAYTGRARIPLADVAIAVTAPDGTALALRLTDRSGRIEPIAVPVPERSLSQSPDPGQQPYAQVNLYARGSGFEQIEIEQLQIFAGTTTNQDLEMIPLSELPDRWDRTEIFDTPPQNL